jgi:hypothetical protein
MEVELSDDWLDVLKVVVLQSLELSDGAKQLNQLSYTSHEKVKFSKDFLGVEIELFGLGHALKSLLGQVVLGLVGDLEVDARVENSNELIGWVEVVVPERGVINWDVLAL